MGFASANGYTPATVQTIMLSMMTEYNAQFGTAYTEETFIGTNAYKFLYAAAQRLQESEVKTSEIFLKVQQYFLITNERISRPVGTIPGLIERLATAGYIASVKPMIDADAGKAHVAVNVDDTDPDYADVKLEINTILSQSIALGIVTQGPEVSTIVASNGQAFDWKFTLPDITTPLIKLTVTTSDNNMVAIGSPEDIKLKLLANIATRYRMGLDFEPQKYYGLVDAPWASAVKLEYSLDSGSTWLTAIYDSLYDDLFDVRLENIELIED